MSNDAQQRTRNHLIMIGGSGYRQTNEQSPLSSTYKKVPRDRETIGMTDLTRVQPMIFKHGLLIKSQDLLNNENIPTLNG